MKNLTLFLRYTFSVIIGYLVMILLLVLAQDLTFGRPELGITPILNIIFAGLGSVLAAVVGGWAAGQIKKHKRLWPQQIMCIVLIIESTYLMSNGILVNPIWFELLAAISLIVGVLIGGWFANYGWVMPVMRRT